MINLQFIESFLLLAENLSFSKTAKIQRTTQPVISRQIKELELYLGKMLFIRTKRSVVLTHEGVEFRNQVMEPLSKLKKAFNHHHEQAENNIWDLKIASIKEAGEKFLYPKLIELKKKFPDCRVTLELMGSQEIEDKILKNEVDLGLIYLQSKRKSILHFNVRKDFPVLIGHTKFSKQEFKSLTKIPMVTYRQSDPYFQGFVDKYFSKNESKKIQIELSINSHKK
ncbi:MAG: LysR family transcriptional regulator [Bacteriovorax sp.]